jgi:hypothetical protein
LRRARKGHQKRVMIPAPTATWLRDDDGALFWPSPMSAVALMMLPPSASVWPPARWYASSA